MSDNENLRRLESIEQRLTDIEKEIKQIRTTSGVSSYAFSIMAGILSGAFILYYFSWVSSGFKDLLSFLTSFVLFIVAIIIMGLIARESKKPPKK